MRQMPRLSVSFSALLLALSNPATAQVSASDLWVEWQAMATASGQTMTADVVDTDTGIVLENFVSMAEQDGTRTIGRLDRITLSETPDGTVEIELSDVYTMTVTFPEEPGGAMVTLTFEMTYDALDVEVSGTPGDRVYDYTADSISLTLVDVANDRGTPPPQIDLSFTATELATTYRVSGTEADDMRFDNDGTLASAEFAMRVVPVDMPGELKVSASLSAVTSEAEGSLLSLGIGTQAGPDASLPEGFDIAGSSSYEGLSMEFDLVDPDQSILLRYDNEGGRIGIDLSEDALRYEISADGMQTHVEGSELPFPIDLSVGASEVVFAVPLRATEDAADAELRLAYEGVTADDSLWQQFDPAGQLPRDPASVVLDVTAQLRLVTDLMALDTFDAETPPAELDAVDLNELRAAIGGAELTGSGALTFVDMGLMPRPVGSIDLSLLGGNALLERLISAGLVTNEQAGMARGVTAMFSRPGDTPDSVETTIEFLEDGQVLANGVAFQ